MPNTTENGNASHTIKCWVELYSDSMYSWALNKTSSKETAEDLVQETFLAAFISFDSFKNKSKPKTWLFSILNNKIIDHYRKKSNNPTSFIQLSEYQATHFTDSLFNKNGAWQSDDSTTIWGSEIHLLDNPEFNDTLKFCMSNLPEKWKIVICSKYLFKKNVSEICQELELTTTNYWQIIHRAKLLLKNCIEKHWK